MISTILYFTEFTGTRPRGSPTWGSAWSLPHVLTEKQMSDAAVTTSSADPASGLGPRLRALRVAAGLTQTALAGDRFSKEYVSQIGRVG